MKALLRNYLCLHVRDSLNIIASNPGAVKEKAVSQSGKNGFICADAGQVVQSRRVQYARTQQTEEHRSRGARHTSSVCRSAYDEE